MYGRKNYGYGFADELRTVLEALLVVFIVLKVNNLIAWSWWLVLVPLWASLGFSVILILIIMVLRYIE